MASQLLEHLKRRVLLLDGAMGSTLQGIDLDIETDYLGRRTASTCWFAPPGARSADSRGFSAAGSDMVETDTFGANKHVLSEFDDELWGGRVR